MLHKSWVGKMKNDYLFLRWKIGPIVVSFPGLNIINKCVCMYSWLMHSTSFLSGLLNIIWLEKKRENVNSRGCCILYISLYGSQPLLIKVWDAKSRSVSLLLPVLRAPSVNICALWWCMLTIHKLIFFGSALENYTIYIFILHTFCSIKKTHMLVFAKKFWRWQTWKKKVFSSENENVYLASCWENAQCWLSR